MDYSRTEKRDNVHIEFEYISGRKYKMPKQLQVIMIMCLALAGCMAEAPIKLAMMGEDEL